MVSFTWIYLIIVPNEKSKDFSINVNKYRQVCVYYDEYLNQC